MDPTVYDSIEECCKYLEVDLTAVEMASFADNYNLSQEQLGKIIELFLYLKKKKHESSVETMLRLGRFPKKQKRHLIITISPGYMEKIRMF